MIGELLGSAIERPVDGESARLRARVAELEASDSITGLLTGRAFRERLSSAFAASGTRGQPRVSLVVLEIDFFAQVAAQHGCESAEDLLRSIGSVIWRHAPGDAACARLGLSRFAVAHFGAVKAETLAGAFRLRNAIASEEFLVARACVRVTASIGVAGVPDDGAHAAALFAQAEAALAAAQAAGGNLACGAGSGIGPENRRV